MAAHPTLTSSRMSANCNPVLHALSAKRTELDARRALLSAQLADLEQELSCLDTTIQLFEQPLASNSTSPPLAFRLRSLPDFRRGEIGETALIVLRSASHPLSTQEVGLAICARRSLTLGTDDFRKLCVRVISYFRDAEKRGIVHAVGQTSHHAILWFAP